MYSCQLYIYVRIVALTTHYVSEKKKITLLFDRDTFHYILYHYDCSFQTSFYSFFFLENMIMYHTYMSMQCICQVDSGRS